MTSNPYETPTGDQAVEDSLFSQRFGWFLVLSIVAAGLSFVVPFLAVPLLFLMAPAFMRAWRLRRLSVDDGEQRPEFGWLVIASMMYAIPSAVASVIAFCCVCFPGAFAGNYVLGTSKSGSPNYGGMLLGGIALLAFCTFCGLCAGDSVLRRFGFFIRRPAVGSESSEEDLAADTDE